MGLTLRRLTGVVLAAAVYLPLHRLLRPERTGPAGAATRMLSEGLWEAGIWGTVVVAASALLLARFRAQDPLSFGAPLARRLTSLPPVAIAVGLGAAGTVLAAAAARGLFGALPTSVDSMVMLAHAGGLAAGRTTVPLPGAGGAWMLQNAWVVKGGMASVYPPGHLLALAAGLRVGAAWLVGPVAAGLTAAFAYLAFERAAPEAPVPARVAGTAVVASPFVWILGGSYLSHTTAAAATALLAWSALEARAGRRRWAFLAGFAVGALVCTRPWTGLVTGSAVLGAAWWPRGGAAPRTRDVAPRVVALAAGGAPWALLLFTWNDRLFGAPSTLGYSAAFGPAHGLGLHPDPWGNAYGITEALAYTGADLIQLGVALFETPLPALAAVAGGLLLLRRPFASRVLWAWAVAPVAANALYWHHGQHLGPRMLYEAAPAWGALVVLALAAARAPDGGLPAWGRRAVGWTVVVGLLGAAAFLPGRLASLVSPPAVLAASTVPDPERTPALLFAHGSWATRTSARLTAAGVRRDSVETLLRRNDACAADRWARWRTGLGSDRAPEVDLVPAPGSPAGLEPRLLSPGNRILVMPGAPIDEACRREAASDRLGTVELEPLLWQALPLGGPATVVARDLGPVENAAVVAAFPGHRAFVLIDGGNGPPRVIDYEEGMELLWRGAAALTSGGG